MPFPSGVRHTHYPGAQVRVTQGFYETSMTTHKPFWFVPGVSLRCSGFSIPVMHLVDSGRGVVKLWIGFCYARARVGASTNSTKSSKPLFSSAKNYQRRV